MSAQNIQEYCNGKPKALVVRKQSSISEVTKTKRLEKVSEGQRNLGGCRRGNATGRGLLLNHIVDCYSLLSFHYCRMRYNTSCIDRIEVVC